MQIYLKRFNSAAILSLLLVTGCASHSDAKLEADMVVLTKKMQALNAELIALKAKQVREQQAKPTTAEQ